MRCFTSAIVLLLSAFLVLARVPLHRRAVLPQTSQPEDAASSISEATVVTVSPLVAYSGISFVALYFIALLRRRCKIRVAGRRLVFGRASTRMGALELEGSEVELLPTVAEPGLREDRPPLLPAVLDDSRSDTSHDIAAEEIVKPAAAQSIPLIPISTMTPLPPPSPFTPPSSPPPRLYEHPSPMRPSRPYDINDHVPVSPYASPSSQHVALPKAPLSPPLLPSSPIRPSRLGSPRPSFSKSRSTPTFSINARFATYPQRSKSSPPLPRTRTKLGHEVSEPQLDADAPYSLDRATSPSPLPKSLSFTPRMLTFSPPPHLSLSRSKSTGSDLIDLTTPDITPNTSMIALVDVAYETSDVFTVRNEVPLINEVTQDIGLVKDTTSDPTPVPLVVELPKERLDEVEPGPRSEVDLVDPPFRPSPATPGAISLSLSNSSSNGGRSPAARPADIVILEPLPLGTVVDSANSSLSIGSSSSSSSPASPSVDLFIPHSVHSTPDTTPMRDEFVFTEDLESGVKKEDAPQPLEEGWSPEISFDTDLMEHGNEWHDHSDVWGSPETVTQPPPAYTAEVGELKDVEMGQVELISFEEELKQEDTFTRHSEEQSAEKEAEREVLRPVEDAAEAELSKPEDEVDDGSVLKGQPVDVIVPAVDDVPVTPVQAFDERLVLQSDATPSARLNDHDDDYERHDLNDESRVQDDLLEAAREDPQGFQDEVTTMSEDVDQEHPDPDLLPLPEDVPVPASPVGLFHRQLLQAMSTSASLVEVPLDQEPPSLLPALVISAPTPSRPSAKDISLRIPEEKSNPPSRLPTPLQTPTPPSSPPPSVSPMRRSRVELPKVDKIFVDATKELTPVEQGKEDRRPAWSIRAADAPPLGLSSVSPSNVSPTEIPTKVLAQAKEEAVKTGEQESRHVTESPSESTPTTDVSAVVESPKSTESNIVVTPPEPIKLSRSLPGSFDSEPSTLRQRSTAKASDEGAPEASPSTSSDVTSAASTSTQVNRVQNKPRTRSAIDIALAMQLRPGVGIGADPAWLVRFLMSMFGWFAVLISGSGEMDALLVGRR